MSRRILVPLDQSHFAEFALAQAGSLVRSGDRVTLATVVDVLPDHPEYAEPLRKGIAEYHSEVGARYFGPDVILRSEVMRGKPGQELLTLLDQVEFDLVVAATHGKGPLSRLWLGSVAHALARDAGVPVLLVRPEEDTEPESAVDGRIRTLTIPLDGSDVAAAALKSLDLLRLPDNATLYLVRVLVPPDPLPLAYVPAPRSESELVQELRERASEYLTGISESLTRKGFDVRMELPCSPSVATAIIEAARRTGSDAIVLSSHGRGALARAIVGSVADKVVRATPLPVMIVPVPRKV